MASLWISACKGENGKWLLAALFSCAAWGVGAALDAGPLALRFYVVTAAVLAMWVTDCLPANLVAVLAPLAYILAGVGTPQAILSVWASPLVWLVMGGLMISDMMTGTGIARRLALWALRLSGASLRRLIWGIALAGLLLAPFVPTAMGKAAIFVIILTGVCQTLNLRPGSREAASLFLAGIIAVTAPKFLFMTSSIDTALLVEMARKSGMEITWLSYFLRNALPGALYMAGSVWLLTLLLRPADQPGLRRFVEEEHARLGPLSTSERKAFALLALLALAMATDSLHHVDIGWIMLAAGGICYMPGLRLLRTERFAGLPLGVVFYVAGSMSIGIAAHAAGVDGVIAGKLLALLPEPDGVGAFSVVYGAATALLMLLTSLPSVAAFTPPLAEVGAQAGGAAQALIYAFLYGTDQFLMPYVSGPALYMFAAGYIPIRSFVLFEGVKFVATAVFLAAVAWPIWTFLF